MKIKSLELKESDCVNKNKNKNKIYIKILK